LAGFPAFLKRGMLEDCVISQTLKIPM